MPQTCAPRRQAFLAIIQWLPAPIWFASILRSNRQIYGFQKAHTAVYTLKKAFGNFPPLAPLLKGTRRMGGKGGFRTFLVKS